MSDVTTTDDETRLPAVIVAYQLAHDAREADAALATFAPTAVVIDDGHRFSGHDEIRTWLSAAASEFTWERTLVEVSSVAPGEWVLVQNLTGNFPGGTVDLRYRFVLVDGLIGELVIAP